MKNFSCLALLLAGLLSASAQYSVPWSKIAGGGATAPSTGGVYAVSGTLGQPDASGALTNGAYAVSGGFWPGVNLLQTPGAPLLAVEQLGGGNVRVFWPLPATGFVLDQSLTVTGVWSQVAFPYATNATHISITVPAAGNKFYRLRRP
jgi:hypothetical protein